MKPNAQPKPLVVQAVEELAARNEHLEREVNRLKGRLRAEASAKSRLRRRLREGV